MRGEYDRAMKRLVDANPEAIVQFIMQQWRLTSGDAIQEEVHVVGQLNPEFKGADAEADGLILMETESGRQFYIHIEFQSTTNSIMLDRLIDYCLRTRRKHGPLPILSCVIHLRDDGSVQEPPGRWDWLDGSPYMLFKYVCIKLYELPREAITDLHQPSLLPLALLTKDKVDRIMARDMFAELHQNKLDDLLPVGQTIAGLVLGAVDLEWLKKEYRKMLDFFKDSPAYQWMTDDAREEGFTRGREAALRELEEARQQRQQTLDAFRQTVVAIVAAHFPKWASMAKKQVQNVENPQKLQEAILFISATQDAAEVANILANLDEEK
jgi:hypothetical protein